MEACPGKADACVGDTLKDNTRRMNEPMNRQQQKNTNHRQKKRK